MTARQGLLSPTAVRETSLAVALLALLTACTPMRSTIEPPFPYQGAHYQEPELRSIADAYCEANGPSETAPYPYTTDGCSMVPDGKWRACCVEHDIKYWCGGTRGERLSADKALKQCVAEESGPVRAQLMFIGTRLGGWPRVPFGWRWGYGHPWPYRFESEAGELPGGSSGDASAPTH